MSCLLEPQGYREEGWRFGEGAVGQEGLISSGCGVWVSWRLEAGFSSVERLSPDWV
jgi:hypothetical protein